MPAKAIARAQKWTRLIQPCVGQAPLENVKTFHPGAKPCILRVTKG